MILNFGSKSTEDLYHGLKSRESLKIPQEIWQSASRKLDMIESAHGLSDLKALPGNRLEGLKGDLKGKYSIRINDQYRILFAFKDGNALDVEIADYH